MRKHLLCIISLLLALALCLCACGANSAATATPAASPAQSEGVSAIPPVGTAAETTYSAHTGNVYTKVNGANAMIVAFYPADTELTDNKFCQAELKKLAEDYKAAGYSCYALITVIGESGEPDFEKAYEKTAVGAYLSGDEFTYRALGASKDPVLTLLNRMERHYFGAAETPASAEATAAPESTPAG